MLALKSKLLEKIDATPVKTAKKVALAYSGGLDSSLCAVLAKEKYQVEELFAITVDVGQGQDEMDAAISKAKVLGITPIVIDAKQEFADLWLTKAIQANSSYEGYPVSTSMTRQLIASKIALLALKLGCDAIMEGSSGKGNDQYRMHNVFKDGIMGLKSRELYEAPAAAVLLKLHHDLEQFTLTKEEMDFKAAVEQKWAYLVYHGAWFSPLKEALDAFIATTQSNVSGTVTANLFHGTIDLESRQSVHSLFFPEIRGLQSRSFNQQLCGPAAQIGGLPWEILAKRNAKVAH